MADPRWGITRTRARAAGIAAGVGAGVGAAVVAAWSAVIAARWARLVAAGAAFALRIVTLRAYRRCPSCYRILRREARVCRSCGGVSTR
jgi:hypothetical protein